MDTFAEALLLSLLFPAKRADDGDRGEPGAPAQPHAVGCHAAGPDPAHPGAAAGQQADAGRAVQAGAGPELCEEPGGRATRQHQGSGPRLHRDR